VPLEKKNKKKTFLLTSLLRSSRDEKVTCAYV